jgi:tRNA (guanosine-2'-O-)-methyltransferase
MNISELPYHVKERYLNYLLGFITDNKINKFEQAVQQRTRKLTIVLENIYQSHNASAVLRSCDCFGIQDVHVIENRYAFSPNPDIVLGSLKWLSLHRYRDTNTAVADCMGHLKKNGYTIVATTPHEHDVDIQDLPVHGKIALLFGTELKGLSAEVMDEADMYMKIPMVGFTESLNISVSAAISLFYLSGKMRSETADWKLSQEELVETKIQWAKSALKTPDLIEKNFFLNEI